MQRRRAFTRDSPSPSPSQPSPSSFFLPSQSQTAGKFISKLREKKIDIGRRRSAFLYENELPKVQSDGG
jgi:hypothetical protein